MSSTSATLRPLRILLSEQARARLESSIAQAMQGRPYELVTAATDAASAPQDVDVAFNSRDVTGTSTKYNVQPILAAFYATLEASPSLQWVHVHSAGADRPLLVALREKGIRVTTSPGANSEVVAQSALAGLLSLAREFPRLARAQREHVWLPLLGPLMPDDIAGQRAVIVGWGPIGQKLGGFLRMLGMEVSVVRSTSASAGAEFKTYAFDDFKQAATGANWLLLACPLTDQTRRMVDSSVFALMAKRAHLVNVSRGEVVVEKDLIEALSTGVLAGAYLDVFEYEPLAPDSPLWDMENVIAHSHSAGHSKGNTGRVDQIFLDHLRALALSR